jgi:hypothetical protein
MDSMNQAAAQLTVMNENIVPKSVSHHLRKQSFELVRGNQYADIHSHTAISTDCAALAAMQTSTSARLMDVQ